MFNAYRETRSTIETFDVLDTVIENLSDETIDYKFKSIDTDTLVGLSLVAAFISYYTGLNTLRRLMTFTQDKEVILKHSSEINEASAMANSLIKQQDAMTTKEMVAIRKVALEVNSNFESFLAKHGF